MDRLEGEARAAGEEVVWRGGGRVRGAGRGEDDVVVLDLAARSQRERVAAVGRADYGADRRAELKP